jgi:hypothetical protein
VEASTGSDDPLLILVTASAGSAEGAEQLASAVGRQLLSLTGDATVVFDPAFAKHELARIPREIAAAEDRLEAVSQPDDQPDDQADDQPDGGARPDTVVERRVASLRETLSALHAGRQRLLELRSETGHPHGLTIVSRTEGRAAPPLPQPSVLAAAGGAAGACLWLTGWLLFRREASGGH